MEGGQVFQRERDPLWRAHRSVRLGCGGSRQTRERFVVLQIMPSARDLFDVLRRPRGDLCGAICNRSRTATRITGGRSLELRASRLRFNAWARTDEIAYPWRSR